MFSPAHYAVLLVLSAPICLWAAWTDLKSMRIPNQSVLALGLIFLLAAPFMLPLSSYLWAVGLMALVLVAGFVLATTNLIGAGDAKLAAAMAPFFYGGDIMLIMFLYVVSSIGALIIHRIAKNIPAVRRMTPDWISWDKARYFPMGFAMVGGFLIYLALMVTNIQAT